MNKKIMYLVNKFSAVSDKFNLFIREIVFLIFLPSVFDHIDNSKLYLSGSQIP